MANTGYLIKKCRQAAKPKRISQEKISEILNTSISYISKVEANLISLKLNKDTIKALANYFTESNVPAALVQEFMHLAESTRITGVVKPDENSEALMKIYDALDGMEQPIQLAYRKELRDRDDIWTKVYEVKNSFENSDNGKSDFTSVLATYLRLEELEDISVSNIRARLRLEISRIYRYIGETGSAKTKVSQALELANRTGDKRLQAEILKERGDFYRRSSQEELKKALEDYECVLEICNDLGDDAGAADAQTRIASILLTAGQLKYDNSETKKHYDALTLCEKSLATAQIRRDTHLERKSLEYKAWTLSMKGELAKSIELQRDAHDIVMKDPGGVQAKEAAKSLTYLAGFYLLCGRLDEAEKTYIKADEFIKQMFPVSDDDGEDKEIFIRALIYLGLGTARTHFPEKRYEARSNLEKSLDYARQSNDLLTQGRALKQLGELEVIEGDFQKARENFNSAEDFFGQSVLDSKGNPYYLSSVKIDKIALDFIIGDNPDIASELEENESSVVSYGYNEYIIKCMLWKAKLLSQDGIIENMDKIVDHYLTALQKALDTDPFLFSLSLKHILADLESFYKERKEGTIDLSKRIAARSKEKTSFMPAQYEQDQEFTKWIEKLEKRSREWDVIEKNLPQKKR